MNQTSIESWREMDRATRSAAYNNGAAVANSARQLARWKALSASLRDERPGDMNLRYGSRPRNLIDLFPAERTDAPLLVFIHGGYWQRNSKDDFSCVAHGPLAHGLAVALVGYALAPEASLQSITAEVRAAIGVLRARDDANGLRRKLVVAGWSAGGHLAALASAWPGVDATLAISGIFDLEPLRDTDIDDKLRLTEVEIQTLSPIRQLAPPLGPVVIAYGTDELPELCRQSRDYQQACRAHGYGATLLPIPDADHFSILDALIEPTGALTTRIVALAGLS